MSRTLVFEPLQTIYMHTNLYNTLQEKWKPRKSRIETILKSSEFLSLCLFNTKWRPWHSLRVAGQQSHSARSRHDARRCPWSRTSQWHSVRSAETELSVVLKADRVDLFVLPLARVSVSVSGHLHAPVCEKYCRGGDMWEHSRDLTGCHRGDKAEQWSMSDRWRGENGREMCSIIMTTLSSSSWLLNWEI